MEEAREAIFKRCLSTPTKPPAKKFAAFASQRNSSNNTEEHKQKNISSHNSVTAESNGENTLQAVTEVDSTRRHSQAESPKGTRVETFSSYLEFSTGIELCESELLLYSLLVVAFPGNSFRARYHEKYLNISTTIENVFHVHFSSTAIANYLYRANNNLTRDLGKVNGILRWRYYREEIERIVTTNSSTLQALISSRDTIMDSVTELRKHLAQECSRKGNRPAEEGMNSDTEEDTVFETRFVENFDLSQFPNWKQCFNEEKNTSHLFYFGGKSIGYSQIEIIIDSNKVWTIRHEGMEKKVNLDWADVSPQVNSIQDLVKLLVTIQSLRVCSGCPFEQFQKIVPKGMFEPVYYTRNGEPAAFVETSPSQHHKKIIRSTSCLVFIPYDEALHSSDICAACEHSKHYLRTLKSRLNSHSHQSQNNENSKFTRFDYLSKEEVLQLLRERTIEMRSLQEKIKQLEKCREKMVEVGGDTDCNLRAMFEKLNEALKSRRGKQISKCKWKECSEPKDDAKGWVEADQLYLHVRAHIEQVDENIAPINRIYKCHWDKCYKTFGKKALLETHLRDHTGYSSDQFFGVLLCDQAKALTVPKRQMRWHPLIIKWCLRMYSKSHAAYEDLRDSGFLKLPSGRLLSDYKNFSSPRSGWQTSTLWEMKEKFDKTKIGKRGQLGGLFFDEVKIKEGLVFDPSTFELVGFVDLDDDETDLPLVGQLKETDCNPQNKLATHVLQFYFKSLFGKFEFPCAFFLTRGVSSQKLNRIFWQGVSMLHGFQFTIMLACCDGAPENRAFMNMNGTNPSKSKCYNPFSKKPLFFISDPPHLLKKLRNNIYSSGFKIQNPRFTRVLQRNGKYILWEHIYSVYQRDRRRRLYATDLRSAHVHLDNLSKMRVKLAVQTLSRKVQRDMAAHENNETYETQEFICMCATLWDVFNDSMPLQSITDPRIAKLNQVLNYFKTWKQQLSQIFQRRADVSDHFITWQTMFDLEVRLTLPTN